MKKRKERVSSESTISSVVGITAEGSTALTLVASESKAQKDLAPIGPNALSQIRDHDFDSECDLTEETGVLIIWQAPPILEEMVAHNQLDYKQDPESSRLPATSDIENQRQGPTAQMANISFMVESSSRASPSVQDDENLREDFLTLINESNARIMGRCDAHISRLQAENTKLIEELENERAAALERTRILEERLQREFEYERTAAAERTRLLEKKLQRELEHEREAALERTRVLEARLQRESEIAHTTASRNEALKEENFKLHEELEHGRADNQALMSDILEKSEELVTLKHYSNMLESEKTFCGKCISEKFKDEDNKRCPACNIDLGCDPKLRADRSLQGISSVIFPDRGRRVLVDGDVPPEMTGPFVFHLSGQEGGDAPPDLTECAHAAPCEPSKQMGGTKRLCADEGQPGSGEPTPKRHHQCAPSVGERGTSLQLAPQKSLACWQTGQALADVTPGASRSSKTASTPVRVVLSSVAASAVERMEESVRGALETGAAQPAVAVRLSAETARPMSLPVQVVESAGMADTALSCAVAMLQMGATQMELSATQVVVPLSGQTGGDASVASLVDAAAGETSTSVPLGEALRQGVPVPPETDMAVARLLLQTALDELRDVSSMLEFLKARSREKSLFIRDAWGHLTEETRLRKETDEQLTAAQQKVAELTLTVEELASLRIREARQHASEAEQKLTELVERSHKDGEEAARVRRELDDLRQAMGGLTRERDLAHQESADAKEEAISLRHELRVERDLKCDLEKELAEAKDALWEESEEHEALRVAIGVICDDLGRLGARHQLAHSARGQGKRFTTG